jgi:hypothetical protein
MAMLSSLAKVVSPEETIIDAHPKRSLEVIPCGTYMNVSLMMNIPFGSAGPRGRLQVAMLHR